MIEKDFTTYNIKLITFRLLIYKRIFLKTLESSSVIYYFISYFKISDYCSFTAIGPILASIYWRIFKFTVVSIRKLLYELQSLFGDLLSVTC